MSGSSHAKADFDIIVIGAGPAGSVSALQLARCGYRVCVVERNLFPRQHVGESLPPSIFPLLESIGLRERIEEVGFLRCQAAHIKWAGAPEWKSNSEPMQSGLQVDRGRFDQILLNAAVEHGVHLIQPATVGAAVLRSSQQWNLSVRSEGRNISLNARFIVDASGRAGCLRAGQRICRGVETLAIFAWWRNTSLTGSETRIEAGQDCWYWGAPLPDGTFNATVFVDRNRVRSLRPPAIEQLYRQLISNSELLQECAVNGIADRVLVCDATCRSNQPAVGVDWCKVGEAAFSLDPLSSQGVLTALASATRGAAVANTVLKNPESADLASRFYADRQCEIIDRHTSLCKELYGRQTAVSNTEFWRHRGGGQTPISPTQHVRIEPMPPLSSNDTISLARHVRFCKTPVLREMLIEEVDGILHSASKEPLVFWGNIDIAKLLMELSLPCSIQTALDHCSLSMSMEKSMSVLYWLWSLNIIES